ncbi:hypothetical protein PS858_01696 [Pseudomonas fluorescens]|uniref:hypothetical protein n=1 Tax=Pseudomonas fluorescens TaxID=294 RepID=UPI00124218BD|nr:hypothetical protein [Pseudomonas fluorescens]VVO78773.1 hypothetical protein PS858_01696 [Pseudomonas fluorescens]
MISAPQPNPRDLIISNLNKQLDQFFDAGKTAEQVPAVVSGEREAMFGTSHSNKLRLERDKLAPMLKSMAATGITSSAAATQTASGKNKKN